MGSLPPRLVTLDRPFTIQTVMFEFMKINPRLADYAKLVPCLTDDQNEIFLTQMTDESCFEVKPHYQAQILKILARVFSGPHLIRVRHTGLSQ